MERATKEGESPVGERDLNSVIILLKYHGTREILWESGTTIVPRLNTFGDR